MTAAFRVDASARIGTGHVMRCLALAEALRGRDVPSRFVCREHPGHLVAAIRERSFPVVTLPDSTETPATEQADADGTIQALGGMDPAWMVVDHYGLGAEWERLLRPRVGRLLVIDDLANRTHDCDLLLDQNYSAEGERRYAPFVPASCALLMGPRDALLAPEYASHRQTSPRRDGAVRRVLVYFGGADESDMTGQALTALSAPEFSHLAVDLVIGTNHPHRAALEVQAAGRPRTDIHGARPHLADLMAGADLAIGAGGITTWERMCLGLPALVVSIAENQQPTCEALAEAGLIEYAGDARSVGAAGIRDVLSRLLRDPHGLATLASRGQDLVDGRGAPRVAEAMLAVVDDDLMRRRHALHEADVRPAGFDTFVFKWIDRCRTDDVLALRNAPHVRAQMRSSDEIATEEHRAFLEDYGGRDRYDFVLVDASIDRYVGAFYVTRLGSTPEVGKYIGDPGYMGKGVARRATERLLDFCRRHAGLGRLVSVTRRDNLRNIALNMKLGFRETGSQGEFVVMTVDL